MKDIYTTSSEEKSFMLKDRLRLACPEVMLKEFEWINPDMRLVLDDVSWKKPELPTQQAIKTMELSCKGKLKAYSIQDLTKDLEELMRADVQNFDSSTTLILYPGDGAETIRDVLSTGLFDRFPTIVLPARRKKDPEGKVIGIDLPWDTEQVGKPSGTPIETIIVLDDVIDSGKTLVALRQKGIFSQAKWFAGTPVLFSPLPYEGRTEWPSSIPGYERIYGSLVLQGENNPVPLNSLSSYLENNGQKAIRLITTCLTNYAQDINDFTRFAQSIIQLQQALK